ncbi:trypsin-like peptidase domain-containing protein [Candidatus Woesearchaeota archaeon]|nr:trypsin-like peptidase domain-containing protein [Candidatus Woesearchaeota archaeon]
MKHFAFVLTLVLLAAGGIAGYVAYDNLQTNQAALESKITGQLASLQEQLASVAEQTNAKIEETQLSLQQTEAKLGEEVSKVKISQQNTYDIFSSELSQVKEESKQQYQDLKDNILSGLKNTDFAAVVEDAIDSVVSIKTDIGLGSGAVIDPRGYIVTNYHVIAGASAAAIYASDGRRFSVSLIGFDQNADIAVLFINQSMPALTWGASDRVKQGESVIAIGSPKGLDFTVTEGIVSALDRKDKLGNTYIQTDVAINPGNSGGPLLNTKGQIIGINTQKVADTEGLGFALASDQVEDIVRDFLP